MRLTLGGRRLVTGPRIVGASQEWLKLRQNNGPDLRMGG